MREHKPFEPPRSLSHGPKRSNLKAAFFAIIAILAFAYGSYGISYNAVYWRSLGPNVAQSGTSNLGFAVLVYIIGPALSIISVVFYRQARSNRKGNERANSGKEVGTK